MAYGHYFNIALQRQAVQDPSVTAASSNFWARVDEKVSSAVRSFFERIAEFFSKGHEGHKDFFAKSIADGRIVAYSADEKSGIASDEEYEKYAESIQVTLNPLTNESQGEEEDKVVVTNVLKGVLSHARFQTQLTIGKVENIVARVLESKSQRTDLENKFLKRVEEYNERKHAKHTQDIANILTPLFSSARKANYAYQVLAGDTYYLTDKQIEVVTKLMHYAENHRLGLYKVNKIAAEIILSKTGTDTKAGQAAQELINARNI